MVPLNAYIGSESPAKNIGERSKQDLASLNVDWNNFTFVHVRFGDYRNFEVFGQSPVLPAKWYADAIQRMKTLHPGLPIVVFSDDISEAKEYFRNDRSLVFFPYGDTSSFGAMRQARHGVLSASTFSWWAARLSADEEGGGDFIAPTYWMGFRSRKWFPSKDIKATFLTYLPVDEGHL